MNKNTENVLKFIHNKNVGIFFDDANIFYASKQNKWKIDLIKIKEFFQKYCKIMFYNYYKVIPEKNDINYINSIKFISKFSKVITFKTKELKYIKSINGFVKKGNVDIEICLDVVRLIDLIEVIVIISGDSDFLELRNYIISKNKNVIFCCYKNNLAFELKSGKYILFENIREFIELKNS